jgi:phage terminase large subunit
MIRLPEKYEPLFVEKSRFFIITGGRGSGKSFSVSYWAVLLMLFEKGHTILFTRYTLKSASISIIPEFISKLEMTGYKDYFEITKDSITCHFTGSKILFRGIKTASGIQTASLKSLQGVTTWILDEAEELIDEKTFDDIQLSVRQKGKQNKIILLMNPTTKTHFVYKRFFEGNGVEEGSNTTKGNVSYMHTTYLDNMDNLDESFLNEIDWVKEKNLKKYEHVILGGWLDTAEGVVFSNWSFGAFDYNIDYVYGMDFGFKSDPSTLIRVAVDKKNETIYLKEEMYGEHLTTNEIYNLIRGIVGRTEVIADSSEPRLIEELKRNGINIKPCIKGAGSVAEGIKLIQNYKLIVDPNSTNIARELNNYIWSDRKADSPVDMYNHTIDAFRYAITHKLKASNTKRRVY